MALLRRASTEAAHHSSPTNVLLTLSQVS